MMRPTEPRICPASCPHLADDFDCDECALIEEKYDMQQAEAEASYDKKAQEDWDEN